jgi:hypothetical protein
VAGFVAFETNNVKLFFANFTLSFLENYQANLSYIDLFQASISATDN